MTINVVGRANLAKYFLVAILCNLLVMGCTVSVPQVESSYRFMKDLISPDNVPSQEQQALWLASVGDRGAVLRPYSSGGLTVFANTDGDAIAFDGWTIRSVVGFGLEGPLSITGKDGKRIFSLAGQITSTECDPWHLNGSSWSQICALGDGQIVLSNDGNIQLMVMSLGENLGNVTLKVAR